MVPSTILMLEDDPDLLNLYTRFLAKAEYQVYPCRTIADAEALMSQRHFDIFITDIHIGTNHSLDLLRRVLEPFRLVGTEIVVVSGRADTRYVCKEIGVDFFLHKPVTGEELRRLVGRLVDAHRHGQTETPT